MTYGRWDNLRSRLMPLALGLALASLLSACAGGSGKPAAITTSPATPTPSPTLAPVPTATPIADPTSVCSSISGSRVSISWTHVGMIDGHWQTLPSTLALKPQPGALAVASLQQATLALKGVTLGVGLTAPVAGTAANVCAVTVKITRYQPLSAPIPNVTRPCSDLPWANPGGVETGADCGAVGGAVGGQANLTFTSTAVGTSATSAFHDLRDTQSTQPVQVPTRDGRQASVWAHITVPASGTYTFSVGIWQSLSGPAVFTTLQATFVVDALHEWSGQACATPAMQAQMPPPTNPPSIFICPGDPPTQE